MSGPPDEPLPWGGPREMGELEATMWRAGRHPQNSTQGAVLEIFDSTPTWKDVRRLHVEGLPRFPRFRQRVVEPALPVGPPIWVDDDDFDLDNHLHRVRLPKPGSLRDLLDAAQRLASVEVHASQPPWVATFIEGLEGGRSAYLLVVHHCLMDGHGSVQLLADLHGRPAQPAGAAASQHPGPSTPPDPLRLAAEQTVDRLRSAPRIAGSVASGLFGALRGGPVGAVRSAASAVRYAASAGRVLSPPGKSASELLRHGSRAQWRFEAVDCSLAELKSAGKAVGGTVNDAYVAGIIGGLRIYHEKRGAEIGDITINMPVSLRQQNDPHGGNRFVTAFIKAPSSIADPAERITGLRQLVSEISGEPALNIFGFLLPIVNRTPSVVLSPLFNSMQDRTDLTISNVPGMTSAVKFAGSTVEGIYYFAPLPGCHISAVLFSYNGGCNIGINCDEEVFGDSDALLSCLRAGMDEVLELRHRSSGTP
jgi:diacylglycerol O-acyltransferase / wax synthase